MQVNKSAAETCTPGFQHQIIFNNLAPLFIKTNFYQMTKNATLILIALCTLLISSCSTSKVNCPDLSGSHHIAKPHISHTAFHKTKKKKQAETVAKAASQHTDFLTASNDAGITLPKRKLMEIAIPAEYRERINKMGIDNLNSELSKYSKYMRVEKRGEKVFVKVSPKEMLKVTRKLMAAAKSSPGKVKRPGDKWEAIALAGGILGIISIVFAWIPYLNVIAFFTSITAIVLGAISKNKADNNEDWAIVGIALGAIALFFSIISIALYLLILSILAL
jgi:hypothetical protein